MQVVQQFQRRAPLAQDALDRGAQVPHDRRGDQLRTRRHLDVIHMAAERLHDGPGDVRVLGEVLAGGEQGPGGPGVGGGIAPPGDGSGERESPYAGIGAGQDELGTRPQQDPRLVEQAAHSPVQVETEHVGVGVARPQPREHILRPPGLRGMRDLHGRAPPQDHLVHGPGSDGCDGLPNDPAIAVGIRRLPDDVEPAGRGDGGSRARGLLHDDPRRAVQDSGAASVEGNGPDDHRRRVLVPLDRGAHDLVGGSGNFRARPGAGDDRGGDSGRDHTPLPGHEFEPRLRHY